MRPWMIGLAAGVAAAQLGVGVAGAETVPPSQAVADHGVFLEHLAPPPRPAAVCIVDSGVDLNPDTAGEVVYREALDGGDPGDVAPDKHGTLMAMMAAAPVNGWGMVGAAPGAVKIVSVRVEEAGEGSVAYSAFERGIEACKKMAAEYRIRVVSLSLAGSSPPDAGDEQALTDAVDSARSYGMDVVAAAGNDGGPVAPPADLRSILAVGAANGVGGLCAFSDAGPQLRVIAPGCELDTADPITGTPAFGAAEGTSEAASVAASVLAALRAYRPDLAVDGAEQLIVPDHYRMLDVQALFAGAGIAFPVHSSSAAPRAPRSTALPRPRVRLRIVASRVLISALNLPPNMRMGVALLRPGRRDFTSSLVVVGRRFTQSRHLNLRLAPGMNRLSVRYTDPSGRLSNSSPTILAVRS